MMRSASQAVDGTPHEPGSRSWSSGQTGCQRLPVSQFLAYGEPVGGVRRSGAADPGGWYAIERSRS
jgi:hypothetical protein